jgi:DNA-binding CsgD family transcriptional regulator
MVPVEDNGMLGAPPHRIHGYVDFDGVTRIELTPRERETAYLIAQGYTDNAIAARLGIAPGTVKNYIRDIRMRLRVRRRRDIAAWVDSMPEARQSIES